MLLFGVVSIFDNYLRFPGLYLYALITAFSKWTFIFNLPSWESYLFGIGALFATLICIKAITLSSRGVEESSILILVILFLNDLMRKHLELIIFVNCYSFLYELILISGSETIWWLSASHNIWGQLFSMILN